MFTIEEITLIKMYSGFKPERSKVISLLKSTQPNFIDGEEEMKGLVEGVVRKLTALTDSAFEEIDLSLALENSTKENE